MTDFPLRPIGELTVNLDRKRVPVKSSERRPGKYPYYGASGVVDHVDGYLFEGLHLLVAEDGENLRSRKTPIAFLADGRFWVNNHAHVVQGNADNDTRFLSFALQSIDISGYITGSAQPKLSQSALASIPVPAPLLATQRSIAATLGSLDDKIESNRRAIETARSLIHARWVAAEKRSTKASTVLEPVLGGTPKRDVDEYWNGPIKWASAKDVARAVGGYMLETAETITDAGLESSAAKVLPAGTVVMTARGTVGALARLAEPMAFNQSCYGLTSETVHPATLLVALESAVSRIQDAGHGTVFNTVNMATFDQIEIELPDSGAIDEDLEELSQLVLQRLQESATLTLLRDALLPELLSGRIRVPEEKA